VPGTFSCTIPKKIRVLKKEDSNLSNSMIL